MRRQPASSAMPYNGEHLEATQVRHPVRHPLGRKHALETNKRDLEGTQKELDAALAYFDKLKPSCVDSGVSYDERTINRLELSGSNSPF